VWPSGVGVALGGEPDLVEELDGPGELGRGELERTIGERVAVVGPAESVRDATQRGVPHAQRQARLRRRGARVLRELHGGSIEDREQRDDPRRPRIG
jgi:hypothetical protein